VIWRFEAHPDRTGDATIYGEKLAVRWQGHRG
jgi:hypothetical protein